MFINEINSELEKNNESNEMNIYEKSLVLLNSCESLMNRDGLEYINYYIEKINSYRLQSIIYNELNDIWNIDLLNDDILKDNKIKNFHQKTLNEISEFEKLIEKGVFNSLGNLFNRENLKYHFIIIV